MSTQKKRDQRGNSLLPRICHLHDKSGRDLGLLVVGVKPAGSGTSDHMTKYGYNAWPYDHIWV